MVYKQFPCLGLHIDRYDLQRRIVRKNASMRPQNDELVLCSIESNELRIALLRLTTADNKLLRDSKDRLCAYSDHKTRAMREGYKMSPYSRGQEFCASRSCRATIRNTKQAVHRSNKEEGCPKRRSRPWQD